jgi:hypothetical protein
MELVITYKQKGDKPTVVFSSTNKQEVQDKLVEVKDDNYLTEIYTLGLRKKAFFGTPKSEAPKKQVAKKKVVAKSE